MGPELLQREVDGGLEARWRSYAGRKPSSRRAPRRGSAPPTQGFPLRVLDGETDVRRFTYVAMAAPPPLNLADLNGLTVLVVDDDGDSLDVVATVLRSCGASILMARTAAAALGYIDTAPRIDVVLTDLAMPDMDGLMLVARIRRHPRRHGVPVVAMTAFYEQYAGVPHFDAFLPKPLRLEQLCSTIQSLGRRS